MPPVCFGQLASFNFICLAVGEIQRQADRRKDRQTPNQQSVTLTDTGKGKSGGSAITPPSHPTPIAARRQPFDTTISAPHPAVSTLASSALSCGFILSNTSHHDPVSFLAIRPSHRSVTRFSRRISSVFTPLRILCSHDRDDHRSVCTLARALFAGKHDLVFHPQARYCIGSGQQCPTPSLQPSSTLIRALHSPVFSANPCY